MQHEHEATTIIEAAIAKDIKILFIVNPLKWLNKSTKSQIYKNFQSFANALIHNCSSVQFKDFHRMNLTILNLESYGGTDDMKALYTGGSRIYHKHIPAIIPHNLQDM